MRKELSSESSGVGEELCGSMNASVHVAVSHETTLLRVRHPGPRRARGHGSLSVGSYIASELHATSGKRLDETSFKFCTKEQTLRTRIGVGSPPSGGIQNLMYPSACLRGLTKEPVKKCEDVHAMYRVSDAPTIIHLGIP